ncbi:hypothetical protein Pmani_016964 [Petrolisthes manimaculis]|uniref:Chitin-binding type-2 domain-containing protein n=1 Tax=Petrolisthes manimaculis TaxID=1843537 RepID=A0AAE1PNC4_9EUCA|nr:hypothetical protein Pmani_016964 [Petrolisthes manimaculis]
MGRSQAQNGNGYSYNGASPSNGYDSPDVLRGDASVVNLVDSLTNNIPGGGVPGEDYPILASIPNTGFNCQDQEFPGYFADTADEAGCQVFHICQFDGRQDSFLCPNGTIFNQQYFVCDWWYNVDCQASEQYRSLNVDIGKVMLNQEESLRSNDVYSVPSTQTYNNAPQNRQVAPLKQTYNGPQERQSLPTPSPTYNAPQSRQAPPTPSPSYTAPQSRQVAPTQTYNAPQNRQAPPTPSPSYTAPQSRQVAPTQTYNAPQNRQAPPTPSPSYTAPQSRQAPITPAPTQTYTNPQERQNPSPINTYSAPEERQVPISPSPSQFYDSPNRF